MWVIRQRKPVPNLWQHLPDNAVLSPGAITVSLRRWFAERDALRARIHLMGIRLAPEDDVFALAGELEGISMVAVEFPSFVEGRGYSQARLLRERLGFPGELRALGARRDHLRFMERCGFDAFELAEGEDLNAALAAFDEIRTHYQPAADAFGVTALRPHYPILKNNNESSRLRSAGGKIREL